MDKFISTIDGNIYLRDCWDCNEGSLIEIKSEDGKYLGDFKGSLDAYTDDELIEMVEENIFLNGVTQWRNTTTDWFE